MAQYIEDFIPFCKNHIISHLDDYEGYTHYGCDWADYLTEAMNADGSFTYDREQAKDYMREWWQDCDDFSEYEQLNFGQRTNPFENPEAFLVCMVIEGVRGLMGQVPIIEKHWNENLELTPKVIKTIKKQVTALNDETEVF